MQVVRELPTKDLPEELLVPKLTLLVVVVVEVLVLLVLMEAHPSAVMEDLEIGRAHV
jgi:hypothetical protein